MLPRPLSLVVLINLPSGHTHINTTTCTEYKTCLTQKAHKMPQHPQATSQSTMQQNWAGHCKHRHTRMQKNPFRCTRKQVVQLICQAVSFLKQTSQQETPQTSQSWPHRICLLRSNPSLQLLASIMGQTLARGLEEQEGSNRRFQDLAHEISQGRVPTRAQKQNKSNNNRKQKPSLLPVTTLAVDIWI